VLDHGDNPVKSYTSRTADRACSAQLRCDNYTI